MAPYRFWKRGKIYYYRLGAGPWKTTGCTAKSKAMEYVLERLEEAKLAAEAARRELEAVSLRDYLKPYYTAACPHVARQRAEKKSIGDEHIKHCRALLDKHVLTDTIADRYVKDLRRGDVEDFRGRLLAGGLGDSQTNRVMRVVKTCVKEGVYREELERDFTLGIGNIRHEPAERGVFTKDELRRLFPVKGNGPWGSPQAYTAFLVAATVGARRGEIMALRWQDVDLDNNEISICQAWKSDTELGPPKWGRTRENLALPVLTASRLRALRAESLHVLPAALVFCTEDGSRLSSRWWQAQFNAGMKAAKINAKERRLTGHSFRHSLATALRDAGVAAEKIQKALGWSDSKTMDGYTHFGAEHLRAQADLIDALLG